MQLLGLKGQKSALESAVELAGLAVSGKVELTTARSIESFALAKQLCIFLCVKENCIGKAKRRVAEPVQVVKAVAQETAK